jgi:hypothetical protein
MRKTICPARTLLVVLLAAAFILPGLILPAWAETSSQDCQTAIRSADAHHRADKIPMDCWRMGPLHLGMASAQLRTLLGRPDASQTLTADYRRRDYPVTLLSYVYPRNLKNWLRLAPARQGDFHPVTLQVLLFKESVAAISVSDAARSKAPSCAPSVQRRTSIRPGANFPYGFHGLTLGAPVKSVETRFGRFASSNASHDFGNYWPVPFSVSGADTVSGLQFATGMAFAATGAMPDFHLRLDPRSCLVTGFTLAP